MLMKVKEYFPVEYSEGKSSVITEHYNLQTKVLEVLPANQNWIHVRSRDDWADVLLSNSKEVIRIYDENDKDKLLAHSVVLFPNANNPDADVLDMNVPVSPENVTTLTSVTSDPDCRGHGLMSRMIAEWEKLAGYSHRSHLLSVITTDNVASWTQFMKNGLNIVGAGYDDSDGSNVYYALKNLNETPSENAVPGSMTDVSILRYDTPLDEMKDMFSQGWVGVAPEREEGDKGKYTGNLIMRLDNA